MTELAMYKTMVEPHPDSEKNLLGWRRPKTAYVLLEIPQYNIIADGVRTVGKGLVTVNAESRADVINQVEIYINKGGRILDYGNFPKLTDANPARASKARLYSQGSGMEPWGALEKFCRMKVEGDLRADHEKDLMKQEIDALKAKLQAQEAIKESNGNLHTEVEVREQPAPAKTRRKIDAAD